MARMRNGVVGLALIGAAAMVLPAGASAAAGPETQSCAAQKRAIKGKSGAAKKRAQQALAACNATNKANKTVFDAVKNGQYVGVRGDQAGVDWVFCANGTYTSAVTSGGSTGKSTGSSWKVTAAKVTGSGFEAVIEGDGGFSVAIGRRGTQWLASTDWEPFKFGNVTRTDAGAACA